MPPRDELLLILDLTASIIRAGVGVKDMIDRPTAEVSTRVGRRPAVAPFKMTDYVVGPYFDAALAQGDELEVIDPMTFGRYGLEVHDWTALEAILRHILHVSLALPRPPLAHPVLLSLPPHLPLTLIDTFHSLLFERLLVPQLLVSSRPFFAAAATGVVSAVVLDIGARGEGTEVSLDGELDVAQALADGNVAKLVNKKSHKKGGGDAKKANPKGGGAEEDEGDYVEIAHPTDPELEPLRIGPVRHRYLEPLFLPQVLDGLRPSTNEAAKRLGMERYEERPIQYAGVQEVVGLVVSLMDDVEQRRLVWESVVIASSGKIAGIKALGPALIPLLAPYGIDPESASETQARVIKFAKVPDYFSEFKQRGGELACYLGGCILAKILISDLQSKLFVVRRLPLSPTLHARLTLTASQSKAEYTSKGPAAYRLLEAL
ncbi:hypothetical protein RQP46_006196 [Phenoliferia psychrophenolica]